MSTIKLLIIGKFYLTIKQKQRGKSLMEARTRNQAEAAAAAVYFVFPLQF